MTENASTDQRKPLGTTPEVAAYLGVPVQTMHNWRVKGVGPRGMRVGKYVRYRWADVEAWLDQQAALEDQALS